MELAAAPGRGPRPGSPLLRIPREGNLGIIITMIKLKKLNGALVVVNADLIESVEAAPDTVINLATGNRFLVKNPVDEVIAKVVEYKKQVYSGSKCVNPIEGFERK